MTRLFCATAAIALLPSLSFAQSICGGAGDDGIWIGGDAGASDITLAADYMQMPALVIGQRPHTTLFTLSEQTRVRIEVEGQMGGDPVIELLNDAGTPVAGDDDSGGGTASRLEMPLDAGTYCVSTSSFDQQGLSALIRVGRDEHDALTRGAGLNSGDAGQNCNSGLDLGVMTGGTLQNIGSVDAAPALLFTLDAPMAITLTAENQDADPTLDLLTMDGTNLASNDDADGLNSRIDMTTPLDPGLYCVAVGAIGDESLPITVSITEFDPVAALMMAVNAGEARPPLDGTVEILDLGTLTTSTQLDATVTATATWAKIALPEGGFLVGDAISVDGNGDPWLAIYDDFGRRMAMNDDANGSTDAQVAFAVNPGTYYVALKEISDERSSFVRLGLRRWVPAQ